MQSLTGMIDIPRLTTTVIEYLPKAGVAIVILLLFLAAYRIIRRPLHAALHAADFHEKVIELIVDKLFRYIMIIFGLVMGADQLGVNVGAALAGLGVAGIAVGFAAQDSVANVISGILIFWDKPFVVGDWIHTADHFGCVSDITLRSTRIRTPRNTYIVIPNKRIIDEVLENDSKHGDLRVDIPLGIAYKESIPAARKVLLEAVGSMSGLATSRETEVVVTDLGDSSVDLAVRVWIPKAGDQQGVYVNVLETCKLALDRAGIEIPFPHLQLFVDEVQPPVWEGASRLIAASGSPGRA
ncbi:MAG TPA: mechanosensitive ion channel family protein [Candidatus Saccharimonadales bacterium]|nr:mechanosensitive ion channel family protein [Candidatus Saccharimonadales bacterium]